MKKIIVIALVAFGFTITNAQEKEKSPFSFSGYLVSDNVMFRIEARSLNSKDEIFLKNNNATASNFFITTAMTISF